MCEILARLTAGGEFEVVLFGDKVRWWPLQHTQRAAAASVNTAVTCMACRHMYGAGLPANSSRTVPLMLPHVRLLQHSACYPARTFDFQTTAGPV
jgi:hypothetical protein